LSISMIGGPREEGVKIAMSNNPLGLLDPHELSSL
jgi:hypothetical protein